MILFLNEESEEAVLTESVISSVETAIDGFLNKFRNLNEFISLGLKFIESLSKDALRIVNRQIQLINAFVERMKKEYSEFFRTQNLINKAGNLTEASTPVEAKYKQFAKMTKDGYISYINNCFKQFDSAKIPGSISYVIKTVAASIFASIMSIGIGLMLASNPIVGFFIGIIFASILVSFVDEHYRRKAIFDGYGSEFAVLSFFASVVSILIPGSSVGLIKGIGNAVINFFVSYLLTKRAAQGENSVSSAVILIKMFF